MENTSHKCQDEWIKENFFCRQPTASTENEWLWRVVSQSMTCSPCASGLFFIRIHKFKTPSKKMQRKREGEKKKKLCVSDLLILNGAGRYCICELLKVMTFALKKRKRECVRSKSIILHYDYVGMFSGKHSVSMRVRLLNKMLWWNRPETFPQPATHSISSASFSRIKTQFYGICS